MTPSSKKVMANLTSGDSPTHSVIPAIPSSSLLLNGKWVFSTDPKKDGEAQEWFAPGFDDFSWIAIDVPHTWNVMPDYLDYEGLAWYRRSFSLPPEARGAHLRLHFEAVFYLAKVWLNGEYLGQHEGGYTPFEFDVSGIANLGKPNLLAVQVDNGRAEDRIPAVINSDWSFDWWNYGGITRDVSLKITSQAYISHQWIISVPHLTGVDQADSASVTATITVQNASAEALAASLEADLVEHTSGRSVLAKPITAAFHLSTGDTAEMVLNATIPFPKLWHFDHPNLYHWSASLIGSNGRRFHTDPVTIGIRSIKLSGGLFYLNGEPVRLVGITRHADFPGQGSAETVTAMTTDYDDLKMLNEVLSRPVHYPQARFILDYADRNGILLIPEVPAWQLSRIQMSSQPMVALEKQQLSEMIAANFNHPSVWAWSIGNELESNTPSGYEFVKQMIAHVKTLDPTRPIGYASNHLYSEPQADATALSDFVLMNQYFGAWGGPKPGLGPELDLIRQTWPDKVVIISEYGFVPRWNSHGGPPTSALNTGEYYFIPDDAPSDSVAADVIRRQLIFEQMAIYRSKPFVSGAIFWTYQDYRTPSKYSTGLVDSQRNRRGSWEILRHEYAPALIDSLTLSHRSTSQRIATVALHTRGPVEMDMPAYTLREYELHWAVKSPKCTRTFSEGNISMPTLTPGTRWSVDITFIIPDEKYIIAVSIVRPTGFSVTDRSYDSNGNPIP
jgi:beta-glucuronidase